jgi:hypothetical protein
MKLWIEDDFVASLLDNSFQERNFVSEVILAFMIEEHGLLPKTHFGGRKGISVDHVIQHLLGTVHGAWGQTRKASVLLLDVSGAYDNTAHRRLIHNLRKLGLTHAAM